MKQLVVLALVVGLAGAAAAQGGISGTAAVSMDVPLLCLYGMPTTIGIAVSLDAVSGNETVGLGGFALPVGYDPSRFVFYGAIAGELPGDDGGDPPTMVFVHTDPAVAATNGWFSLVGATSADSVGPTYWAGLFTGRFLAVGDIPFDLNPAGLPAHNQMSLASKWTSSSGGPESIAADATDATVSPYGKIVLHSGDYSNPADGASDLAVYRPSNGKWYIDGVGTYTLGGAEDFPVPGDYDHDGITDAAVFTPVSGKWVVRLSSTGTLRNAYNGAAGDIPVQGDYDGDGYTDFAVYRPTTHKWTILYNQGGTSSKYWGLDGDIPIPARFDGDAKTDIAVYRPSAGRWLIIGSVSGGTISKYFGLSTDVPMAGDYDNDGQDDLILYRASANGIYSKWFVMDTNTWTIDTKWNGLNTDIPVPCDRNGDGFLDLGLFREVGDNKAKWIFLQWTGSDWTQLTSKWFGLSTDVALGR